jgi:hypothetical protein
MTWLQESGFRFLGFRFSVKGSWYENETVVKFHVWLLSSLLVFPKLSSVWNTSCRDGFRGRVFQTQNAVKCHFRDLIFPWASSVSPLDHCFIYRVTIVILKWVYIYEYEALQLFYNYKTFNWRLHFLAFQLGLESIVCIPRRLTKNSVSLKAPRNQEKLSPWRMTTKSWLRFVFIAGTFEVFLVCTWRHRRHVGVPLTRDFSLAAIAKYTN